MAKDTREFQEALEARGILPGTADYEILTAQFLQAIHQAKAEAELDILEWVEDDWYHTDTVKRFERKLAVRRQRAQKRLATINQKEQSSE